MTTAHNHPPRCCCPLAQDPNDPGQWGPDRETCPLCPEHGELAQLAGDPPIKGVMTQAAGGPDEPKPGECPICHQPIGREHTDYCRIAGPVSPMITNLERLAADDPIMGVFTQTTQPATTTSQPTTQARYVCDPPRTTPDCPMDCDHDHTETLTYRTPGYDGPEGTEWPRTKLTPSAHVWGHDTHYPPRGQGDPHHISQCGSLNRNCPLPPAPTTDDNPR